MRYKLGMYGTITRLRFRDDAARTAAIKALERLVNEARNSPSLVDCYVLEVGASEAVMFTLYLSEEKARELSASTRVHLGEAIGRYVSGPPERLSGTVVVGVGD